MKRVLVPFMIFVGVLLLFSSLYMLAQATQNSADFDRLHAWLLILNISGALILLVVTGMNLYRLVHEYRKRIPGSRLTARLVGMLAVLAVVPVIFVYYFSVEFLSRGIDSWFNVRVEQALNDSLELSRTALDVRMRELQARTEHMSRELSGVPDFIANTWLHDMRRDNGASDLTLFGASNRIIAASTGSAAAIVPEQPGDDIMLQLRQGRPYVGLDPIGETGLHIRAIVPVPPATPGGESRILQALFPIAERQSALAESVQTQYRRYRELTYLQTPLKYSFILTLSLILLLSLLAAVWGAFFAARRLMAPIQDVVEGTRAVARGELDTRLPLPARDEVGFLVLSFNEMTSRLADARQQAQHSQQLVESERAYLQTVLGRLSSGVIALDLQRRLRAANAAAAEILETDLERHVGRSIAKAASGNKLLDQLIAAWEAHFAAGETEWREEVVLRGKQGRRILMCSCTALPGAGQESGYVLVFDDITMLVQAQRDSAWGEVARRLAHEIKNPLTPIQLAAERLQHKFLPQLNTHDADALERATRTIIQQVQAMQGMVNAFSEYARTPEMDISTFDLNQLVAETVEFYRSRDAVVHIDLSLDKELPPIEADSARVRQMLHNLIRNAQEALENQADGSLAIHTYLRDEDGALVAELVVEDNGPGFDPDMLGRAFEPYVSSKPKGTGLGLAIVKKLAEEHGGSLHASNRAEGGARLIIRLPLNEGAHAALLFRTNPGGRRRNPLRRNTA